MQEHIDSPASFGIVNPRAYFRRKGQSIAALLAKLCPSDLPVSVQALISAPFRLSLTILYLLSPFSL